MGIEGSELKGDLAMCGSLLRALMDLESLYFSSQLNVTYTRLGGNGKIAARKVRRHPLVSGEPRKKLVVELLCQITTHGQPNSRSGEAVAIAHLGANEKSSTENYCSKSLLIVTGLGELLAEKVPSFSFPQAAFLP